MHKNFNQTMISKFYKNVNEIKITTWTNFSKVVATTAIEAVKHHLARNNCVNYCISLRTISNWCQGTRNLNKLWNKLWSRLNSEDFPNEVRAYNCARVSNISVISSDQGVQNTCPQSLKISGNE
uniref:Uncharacterized protein n=1 Tax=Glossina pallidipes TaxID=7398 RepID=A0A1A9ZWN2_GLOPL